MHGHSAIVDGARQTVERQRFDLMLTVGTGLHEHGSRFGLMHVDQRDTDFVGRQTIDERGDVGRQSGAAVLRVEISQSSVQRGTNLAGASTRPSRPMCPRPPRVPAPSGSHS